MLFIILQNKTFTNSHKKLQRDQWSFIKVNQKKQLHTFSFSLIPFCLFFVFIGFVEVRLPNTTLCWAVLDESLWHLFRAASIVSLFHTFIIQVIISSPLHFCLITPLPSLSKGQFG
jgi:hypothetical protein